MLTLAKPDIERIPTGFFRGMMLDRLKELSGSSALNNLKVPAMSGGADSNGQRGAGGRMNRAVKGSTSPTRVVISLLLQNPKLIEIIEQYQLDWSRLDFPGIDLLSEIVNAIELIRPENTGVLLEFFRDKANEKIIYTMVNSEVLIQEDDIEAEFSGALKRLQPMSNEAALNKLWEKLKTQGLNSAEKEQLSQLLELKKNMNKKID
jgi:DNA primase